MTIRDRAIRLAQEASQMPVEERVLIVDVLLFSGEIPDCEPRDEVGDIVARIDAGDMSASGIERVVSSLASRLPPRDRAERDFLIRQLSRRHGAIAVSTGATIRWLNVEFARFAAGADWRRERHSAACPFTDERRLLMWRIKKFGNLPGRSSLFEILNPDQ